MSEAKHVHVIGIGGSAMAPLAGMLRERGFRVTGSDSGVYPPASTLLESLGVAYYNRFDAAHLQLPPDLAVIGNVIARGNPELEEVLDRRIPYRSLPEMLEEVFLPGKHSRQFTLCARSPTLCSVPRMESNKALQPTCSLREHVG